MACMRVAVVGGGIIGLSTAWQLALEGVEAVVLERGEAGREATWASAGMLAPNLEAEPGEEALLPLLLESGRMWPKFAEQLEELSGIKVNYRTEGAMAVALNRGDVEELRFQHSFQRRLGLDVKWMDGEEALEMEPNLNRNILAALYSGSDHQVDNRLVVKALKVALQRSGGVLKEHTEVKRIIVEGNRVRGVMADGLVIGADYVVVAAGAWSRRLEGIPDNARPPVRPVKGQMLSVKTPGNNPLLTHVVWGPTRAWGMTYLVPRLDNRILVGSTVEEMGFDKSVTAGGLMNLLRGAWEVFPPIYDLPVDEVWAGLRPGSVDDAPILGPTEVEGLVMAVGHFRNGILLAPITAEAVVKYILEGGLPEVAQPFTMNRFRKEVAK
ncbi:MAG TPA: glycine oxidase ThiO [Aigarchaeota archaeon]|nr:glycine oxidase ThiO [Aigarchaeota archaeon]